MTLAAPDIERWARQIILPEVGGRGQERLLGATAAVVGESDAARFAADLLARAGLRSGDAATSDVIVDFSSDRAGILTRGRLARDVANGITIPSLNGLNSPRASSSDRYLRSATGRHSTLQRLHDPRLNVLTSHESRGHMPSDLRRYMFAAVFADVTGRTPKMKDFPEALLPDHQNVELARMGKMFNDRFRVQLPDQVATTITSHISKDGHYFIHYDPSQCRSLTVREAARLQTFPDNYKFEGNRTAQYHQVGNAVPPYLAMQIAEIIAEVLDAMKGDR